jgi:N-acetylmuramoyl-L-alanine amidase
MVTMKTYPRNNMSIDRIYLHKNEGPKGVSAAVGLASYLNTIDGGYHAIVDNAETVRCASDFTVVEGAGGDNDHSLHVCMIGYSAQPWGDAYDWAQFERAAQQVALWCKAHNVPVVHAAAGAPGQAPTQRGIVEHADDHDPLSEGHTDPGIYFPIESFVQRVAAILGPPPIDPELLKEIAAWLASMEVPCRLNDRGDKVASLNDWLIANGADPELAGNAYGVRTSQAVHVFKVLWQLDNQDGTVAGHDVADALIAHIAPKL